MDTENEISAMAKAYKKLAKKLGLTMEETLLIIVARELIILNEKIKGG
jgi:peroxiredoxin